jgi:putative NADH-flavin reductase
MNIVVFGASGKVGRLIVAELLRRGHAVTAFVHKSPIDEAPELSIVKGDIYNRDEVTAAVTGHDAVVSALGSWGTNQKNIQSTAMERIVPAMEAAGISRIVSVTGHAARAPGDKANPIMRLMRVGAVGFAPKILRDGEDHITILNESGLMWTVVRSGIMTKGSSEAYTLAVRSPSQLISRHAVVHAMVDLVESDEWPRRAPFIRGH